MSDQVYSSKNPNACYTYFTKIAKYIKQAGAELYQAQFKLGLAKQTLPSHYKLICDSLSESKFSLLTY